MDSQPSDEAQPATTRNRENNRRFRLPQVRVTVGVVIGVLLGFLLGGAVFGDWKSAAPDPSLAYNNCAESVEVSSRVGSIVLLADRGPRGKPEPDRRIELRAQKHPTRGWIVWTYFAQSTSSLDRLWIDWSYVSSPSDPSTYRQCGPQPITEDAATHGLLATDEAGRARWFRACGQVPTQDRAPDQSGTICTSWTRPQV